MKRAEREQYSQIGMWMSLLCTSLAVLLALGIVTTVLGIKFLFEPEIGGGVSYGLAALFLSAAGLGRFAGLLTWRRGVQDPRAGAIGVLLAVSCLVISTLAGSLVGNLHLHGDAAWYGVGFRDYVFKPLFWVLAFGIFPAIGLGALFTSLMGKAISRVEARGAA